MKSDDRYIIFGKCCWSCGNKECWLSQINNQPPHESSTGRDCNIWKKITIDGIEQGVIHK